MSDDDNRNTCFVGRGRNDSTRAGGISRATPAIGTAHIRNRLEPMLKHDTQRSDVVSDGDSWVQERTNPFARGGADEGDMMQVLGRWPRWPSWKDTHGPR